MLKVFLLPKNEYKNKIFLDKKAKRIFEDRYIFVKI